MHMVVDKLMSVFVVGNRSKGGHFKFELFLFGWGSQSYLWHFS